MPSGPSIISLRAATSRQRRRPATPPARGGSLWRWTSEPQPLRHRPELRRQPLARVSRRARLEVDVAGDEPASLAVGLQIDAGGERLVEQEGEDVIAMHALGRGGVDFDPVAEAEQALGAVAVPDQRVERGEQGLAADAAGTA